MTDNDAIIDLTLLRTTARYHVACLFLEKLRRDSTRRVLLRRTATPVYEISTWLSFGLELHERADQIDDMTMAVALSDSGFDLKLTARGDLLTNCSAEAMHRYGRQMSNVDEPLIQTKAGTWEVEFPLPDRRWAERLARIDAEIAA